MTHNNDKQGRMTSNLPMEGDSPTGFFLPDLCEVKAVLFLVLVAELLAIVLTLNGHGFRGFDWQDFALTSLFVQWAFLTCAASLCQLRPCLSRMSQARGAAYSYLLIVGIVAVIDVAGQLLLAGALGGNEWAINIDELLTVTIIAAVLAGIALRYFYLTRQLQWRQQAELQARIQALQSRIRPHFLFNSMNIIASLIAVDQDAAERAVEDLSALFRASLGETNTQVSLAEELELCRSYARIEQFRLGKRLQLSWQLNNVPLQLSIPSLTLQPLLENAIYHGIQSLPAGGQVKIIANYHDQRLTLSVVNPYIEVARAGGNQMALQNIQHRLQAIYGDSANLLLEKTTENEQNVYRVSISYPVAIDVAHEDDGKEAVDSEISADNDKQGREQI